MFKDDEKAAAASPVVNWQIQDQIRSKDDFLVVRLRIPTVRNGTDEYLDKVHHRALEVILKVQMRIDSSLSRKTDKSAGFLYMNKKRSKERELAVLYS